MPDDGTVIPAGQSRAVRLSAGRELRLVNTHGSQVVDAWAFNARDLGEHLSTEHTRSTLEKLAPAESDPAFSNRRRPILTLVEDTSPGCHDMLLSACDAERYRQLGHEGPHANCVDNLRGALASLSLVPPQLPSPWNLFQRVEIGEDGRLEIRPPLVAAGQHVTLRAELDLALIFSACPMDIALTNGPERTPRPVAYQLL